MRHWLQFILLLLAASAFAYAPKPKEFLPSTPTGQRASMVDTSGTNTYGYDSRDRLLTNATPQGTLVYSYDNFGRLAAVASTRSGGASVSYTYDALNRLSNVVDAVAGTTTYGYNGVGSLQTVRYPNAVTNTYTYDALNRLTNLVATASSGTLASFAYRLAAAGNRTNLVDNIGGTSRTFTWGYDPLYRLTNEVVTGASPTGTISYRYDAVGNRTNRTSGVTGLTNQALPVQPEGRLRWRYRDSTTRAWRHVDLEPCELIRRFLQHVLPRGFHRVRRFGWWHPGGRAKLKRVRALLHQRPVLTPAERAAWQPPERDLPDPADAPPATRNPPPLQCARCGGVLVLVERWRAGQRPAWRGQERAPP